MNDVFESRLPKRLIRPNADSLHALELVHISQVLQGICVWGGAKVWL